MAVTESNFDIAQAFADQFDPPPRPVQTQKINNIPMRDAWLVAKFDPQARAGITAHAYAGQIHAYVEALAPGEEAERVGRVMAAALRNMSDDESTSARQQPVAEGPQGAGQRPQEGDAEQDDPGR